MAEYRIEATYLISSTTEPTNIVQAPKNKFTRIEYPLGTPIQIVSGTTGDDSGGLYTFPTTGLQTVYFFTSSTTIPQNTFNGWSGWTYGTLPLVKVIIPEGITTIGQQSFQDCELLSAVTLPTSLTLIEASAFDSTGIHSLYINSPGLTTKSSSFARCNNLTSITVDSATEIATSSFDPCPSLLSAYFARDVHFSNDDKTPSLGHSTLLTAVTLPKTIKHVGYVDFKDCTSLPELWLPNTLQDVQRCAFENCSSLLSITATSVVAPTLISDQYNRTPFENIATGGTLYYPAGSDYSSWLSTNGHYLGYYGWNGVPVTGLNRDIVVDDTSISVGSGSTTTSTTVNATDCFYNGFICSTGGSFSITATPGPNDTIVFTIPENDTTSARTGYVYLTLFDSDNNEYYQTVTITQAAGSGSSPGQKNIYLSGFSHMYFEAYANCKDIPIIAENCTYSSFTATIDYNPYLTTAHSITITQAPNALTFCITENSGSSVLQIANVTMTFYDTDGNSYQQYLMIDQYESGHTPTPTMKDITFSPTAVTVNSATTSITFTVTATNCTWNPSQFSYYSTNSNFSINAVTATSNTFIARFTANTGAQRSTYLSVTTKDTDGDSYTKSLSITQLEAGSTEKRIYLSPETLTATSADTGACTTIVTENCTWDHYEIDHTGGTDFASNPTVTGNQMCFTFPANTGSSRSKTWSMYLYDTDGNRYGTFVVLNQQASGSSSSQPDPWSNTGDTAYTWYKDDSLLKILPAERVLSYNEVQTYWPVTAHSFSDVEVRASGDVSFTYNLVEEANQDYNSHSLYATTENNTGNTQQVSTIKLVAYSGTSAYSASTVLMKNPQNGGWITATPNPVNAESAANSKSVYLTLTNCQRSTADEDANNSDFYSTDWISVSRVNNTALTFTFAANETIYTRSIYYNVCGRDGSNNLVILRITLNQSGNTKGITITPDRTSLGKASGFFTARVESTEEGAFTFSASPWFSITSYAPFSSKGGTLYVDYSENTGGHERTGNIWVTQQISTAPYTLTAYTTLTQAATAETANITINPSSISVGRQAGQVQAQVTYYGLASDPSLVEGTGNMDILSYELSSGLMVITYGANGTSLNKSQSFIVSAYTAGGNPISATFTLTQGSTDVSCAPIWRDYVLSLPADGQGFINYNISHDGTVVYTGRAYAMGQNNIEIFFNHLCKPFLSNRIDFEPGYQSIREWLGNFIISSPELGDITSINFYEDYSYENRPVTSVMSLNNPIINEVVEGAYVPFSFFSTGETGSAVILANGSILTGLTMNDNEQHRYFVEAQHGQTYTALGTSYKTINSCEARYSLYYVNSYGGVDVLPCKGKSFKKTDNITRLNYSRSFRNNTREFENVNYMNEIKPAWELNTSYMVDEQSRKMHELVESTCVYLYDAEEQTYTPVVMTDKKLEYKTYFNQGRKFYTYTINVEESQSKEKR